MSKFKEGDKLINSYYDDATHGITEVGFYGRNNPEYAIERLTSIIICAEHEKALLTNMQDKGKAIEEIEKDVFKDAVNIGDIT